MRLLIISHPCVTSVNQQLYAQVEHYTGWNVTIVAPSSWKTAYDETAHLERWPDFQGDLIACPVWLSGNIPLHLYRTFFRSILNRTSPDAIYVHNEPYAASTAQAYLARTLWCDVPIGFYSAQNIMKSYPPPFRWMEKWVFNRSSFAFPVTEDVKNVLRRKGFEGRAPVLPLGIDPSLYTPSVDESLRRQWKTRDEEVIIGYLGRIVEEKGLGTLVQALSRIRDLPWKLVLVGSGPFERELKRQIERAGLSERVRFSGYVPHTEAPRYLASFDLLVLPSETQPNWKEQFGRVVVEALACGTPVLGSDSGAIPDVIRSLEGGRIFPERDIEACAQQLASLIQAPDTRSQLASKGRQLVLDKYTHAALAERFAETIERAVASPHPA